MAKGWLNGTSRPGRTKRPRTLTNNAERGSNNWKGMVAQPRGKKGIRRLMKRDISNAQGTPDNQLLVGTHGVAGRSGASRVSRIMGKTESRQTPSGSGTEQIKNRGVNRSLKKR